MPLKFEIACGDLVSFHYDELLVERIRQLVHTLLAEIAVLLRILLRGTEKNTSYREFHTPAPSNYEGGKKGGIPP